MQPDDAHVDLTASRRRSTARRAFLLGTAVGAILCGAWAFWDKYLQMSYELVVVSDGSPESELVWFWLDGEAFFTRRTFRIEGSPNRVIHLTHPQLRATRVPALLEIARLPNGWRDPTAPAPANAERIPVKGGGHRLRCTILAEVAPGRVAFRSGPRRAGDGPCERSPTPAGYD